MLQAGLQARYKSETSELHVVVLHVLLAFQGVQISLRNINNAQSYKNIQLDLRDFDGESRAG